MGKQVKTAVKNSFPACGYPNNFCAWGCVRVCVSHLLCNAGILKLFQKGPLLYAGFRSNKAEAQQTSLMSFSEST